MPRVREKDPDLDFEGILKKVYAGVDNLTGNIALKAQDIDQRNYLQRARIMRRSIKRIIEGLCAIRTYSYHLDREYIKRRELGIKKPKLKPKQKNKGQNYKTKRQLEQQERRKLIKLKKEQEQKKETE